MIRLTLPEAVSDAFTDAVALIGVLAGLAVTVVLAGIGVRVGIKWLRQWMNKA